MPGGLFSSREDHRTMAKMWKGRFKTATHPLMEAFGQSISFDRELGRQDVLGSLAHAKMLHRVGLLSRSEHQAIRKGLEAIGRDIAAGTMAYDPANEDIHMSVEAELTKRIGEPARSVKYTSAEKKNPSLFSC